MIFFTEMSHVIQSKLSSALVHAQHLDNNGHELDADVLPALRS